MVLAAMLAIMAGCAAFLYLKGTLVQGVTMIFNAIIAGFVALGFFEMLARLLVRYSPGVADWADMTCFLLLFVLTFAVLQTIAMQLGKERADLGMLPERIGRITCGILLGYVVTGYLLVGAAMAPLPSQYPYQRFDERNPDPGAPSKPLLSPDGFVTGLFAAVSKGSFRTIVNPKSFAVFHADYLDQLYLNRHRFSQDVGLMTTGSAISVDKNGLREAPENLRDAEGKPLSIPSGESLILVRVEFNARAMRDSSKFTLSQLRLVGAPKGADGKPLAGNGQALYPTGYIGDGKRLEHKPLDEVITLPSPSGQTSIVVMDLAFYVPTNLTPVLLEFRRNNVVQVRAAVSDEDAPPVVPFGGAPEPAPQPASPAQEAVSPTAPPASQGTRDSRGLSDLSRSIVGDQLDEN